MTPGSKELAPEERGAVKILHVGLLLQGPPPASTRKDRRLWERGVAAPDRKAASEARKHRTHGLEIEGAGARERGDVKFLHVGLLLLGQPEASSGKEQAAVRGRCSRCWPAGCRSGSWS